MIQAAVQSAVLMGMTRWFRLLALAPLAACLPESVETVTLTPTSPEIEAVLREADARWEAAGVGADRIQIGPGGAPVRLVPERCGSVLPGACVAETRTIGKGTAFAGVRWMELYNLDVGAAAHEMGHAMGIKWHPEDIDAQTAAACAVDAPNRPLMCAHMGASIGEWDVTEACVAGPCEGFSPEN